MLNLQIASLYADLKIDMATFNRQLGQVQARLASFKPPPIVVKADTAGATARLNLLMQQIRAMQSLAGQKANVGIGGGRSGSGRSGDGGRSGLLTGVGEGLGLGYLANPQMAAGAAIGAGLKEVVSTAIDLESKFAEIRRVTGFSAENTEKLKKELMTISTMQAGVTLEDLIKIADTGGRMGIGARGGASELAKFAADVAMVRNAVSGIETEQLVSDMSKVLTVFEQGPEYIRGFGSALTAMDNASNSTASELLKVTQGLSGTAMQIGLTIPQVLAFSSVLKEAGLSNAVASSSYSQIFRMMARDVDGFAKAAGVDAKTFADAYRKDPIEALALLFKALEKIKDTVQGQQFIADLGLKGVRTAGAFQQAASAFDKYAGRLKVANAEMESGKALLDANALKGDTTAGSLGKLANVATGLADSIGSRMLPDIKALTDGLLDMATAADAGAASLDRAGKAKGPGAGMGGGLPDLGSPEMDRAAQRHIPKALDWLVNNVGGAGSLGRIGQNLGKIGQASTGSKAEMGQFNGFQRISDWWLGKPIAPPPAVAGKLPALPVKPAFIPPKPPDPAGLHAIQGLASRLGLTVNRREADEKGKDAGAAGSLDFSVRGGGLLGNGAGKLAMGMLTGNLGAKLGGLDQLAGGALSGIAGQAGRIAAPAPIGSASVGMSGADFGRKLQEDILNGKKNEEVAKNTGETVAALQQMLALARQGGKNSVNALLGPD